MLRSTGAPSTQMTPARGSLCQGCLLGGRPQLPLRGNRQGRFLIVTKSPFKASQETLLSRRALQVLAQALTAAGFQPVDFAFQGAVQCGFDPDTRPAAERKQIHQQCRGHLAATVRRLRPAVIIPLGKEATEQVYGRPVKITTARGVAQYSSEWGTWVLPLLDPSYVVSYPQYQPLLQSDCRTLQRLVVGDYDLERVAAARQGDYQQIDDLQFLIEQAPPVVSFDLETTTLRFAEPGARLLTLQFATEPGRAYLLPWDHPEAPRSQRAKQRLRAQLRSLLTRPGTAVWGANLKFDATWLWYHLGVDLAIAGDVIIVAALLDENLQHKDLDTLCKLYYPEMAGANDSFNATVDKARLAQVPLAKLLTYGCNDVTMVRGLYPLLYRELAKDSRLLNYYQRVSLPAVNAFKHIEVRGARLDVTELQRFETAVAQTVAQQQADLLAQVHPAIKHDHVDKGLSFTRAAFISDILFKHPQGFKLKPQVFTEKTQKLPAARREPSTSAKDHLPYFFDRCPFTVALAEHVKTLRLLGTNVRRFKDNYLIGERIYPSFSITKTVTGRSSSENPNSQNYPQRGPLAKAYRKIFIPEPGHYLINIDYATAELRIAASLANEQAMLAAFQRGIDIHAQTAAITMRLSLTQFQQLPAEDQKAARQRGKAVAFGLLYGISWRSLISYAKTNYGVDLTEKEAQRLHKDFFAAYPGLVAWHRRMRTWVRQHQHVRSPTGRIRHLPQINSPEPGVQAESERQAINSPVQETASTLGLVALAAIDQRIDPQYLRLLGFVHDSIIASCPYAYLDWAVRVLKATMEQIPIQALFGVTLKAPLVAEPAFGVNGGELLSLADLQLGQPYDYQGLPITVPPQQTPPQGGRRGDGAEAQAL